MSCSKHAFELDDVQNRCIHCGTKRVDWQEEELTKAKAENTLLRFALNRAKRINASGVLPSVKEINDKGYNAGSWLDGESYGFDRCREGVTLLIDEVLASCADAPGSA